MQLQKEVQGLRRLTIEISNSSSEWEEYFEVNNFNNYQLIIILYILYYVFIDGIFYNGSSSWIWYKLLTGSQAASVESF